MQLDGFFEDLEARFESELEAAQQPGLLERANLIRVVSNREGFVDLVACLLGFDFVAGMALGRNDWQLIRFEAIAEMQFSELREVPIPRVRFLDLPVVTFIDRLPMPLAVRIVRLDQAVSKQSLLLELRGDCLITQNQGSVDSVGIPLQAVDRLHIDSVENLSTDD